MGLFSIFKKKSNSAQTAKDRLQIVLTLDGKQTQPSEEPAFMEEMKREIAEVIRKYIPIEISDIETSIERDGENEVLALNINLPDNLLDRIKKTEPVEAEEAPKTPQAEPVAEKDKASGEA